MKLWKIIRLFIRWSVVTTTKKKEQSSLSRENGMKAVHSLDFFFRICYNEKAK
jgi:hypothetical protein